MAKQRKPKKNIARLESTGRQPKYVRGTLIKKMYEYFDKTGIDKITYDKCKTLAKKIKPNTKFNRYHYAWYRNDYRNKRNLPSPTTSIKATTT